MSKPITVVINFRGGIVSPGYLKKILDIAAEVHITHVRFGLRQQLVIHVAAKHFNHFSVRCADEQIAFHQAESAQPNIVSAYGAAGIFSHNTWLGEGVYKDIFDLFNFEPVCKVNICDSRQNLVPFFTGHLNWVSSDHTHFWYLYIRFPASSRLYCWPHLIYTNDIAPLSKTIGQVISDNKLLYSGAGADGNTLFGVVQQAVSYISKPVTGNIELTEFRLPYYEGFNKDNDAWWLGIYRRDERYPVNFLQDICAICQETKVGQFYTTPWKSIIIKGIQGENRNRWDYVLNRYRINVRHAANELNWQVEDNDEDGLIIKRHVIRYFDKEDVRTYGLSFAVKTNPASAMFGSVIISRQQKKNASRLKSMDLFDICHTKDFNPNTTDIVLFRKGVTKEQIGAYLVSLCKLFYERNSSGLLTGSNTMQPAGRQVKTVYQCSCCLSVYDADTGDEAAGIPAGTPFTALPSAYTCTLCDAAKDDFTEVEESALVHPNG